MWGILKTDEYERRYKRYDKKKSKELIAVLSNLDIFLMSLRSGRKPKPFAYGFLHVEPSDVIAIDQTGNEGKVSATRLYVYPDTETETLYLLTIGDKSSQKDDIQNCKRFVKQIKAEPNCGGTQADEQDDNEDGDEEQADEGGG
jgi:hypothetical protein